MKEKDDFSALFQSLGEAKMPVKEGFWEDLEKDLSAVMTTPMEEVPTKRAVLRPIYRRWMAAASVLLVLALGSVAFWYLNSQEQDIQQAFSDVSAKLETSPESNLPEGDTPIIYNKVAEPVAAAQRSMLNDQRSSVNGLEPASFDEAEADDDDEMVPVEVTFQIIERGYFNGGKPNNGLTNASNGNLVSEGSNETATTVAVNDKKSGWALKPAFGSSLPKGDYNMPLTAGMTVERKLNKTLSVEAGLLYNYLPVSNDESQSSLSLPVKLDVNLTEGKKVDVYATVGGVVEKLLGKSFSEEPVQLAATAGLGVRYKFTDNLAVYAEPSVSHYFDTDGTTRTLRTEQAVNVNLLCGVRMSY
ncbi:MAG: outer membrane beta-barrel protein [Bacteroidaceae bacterium]|nr:outer membrane beta-barrel protein [Bacteroidaceae bacterium]